MGGRVWPRVGICTLLIQKGRQKSSGWPAHTHTTSKPKQVVSKVPHLFPSENFIYVITHSSRKCCILMSGGMWTKPCWVFEMPEPWPSQTTYSALCCTLAPKPAHDPVFITYRLFLRSKSGQWEGLGLRLIFVVVQSMYPRLLLCSKWGCTTAQTQMFGESV